MSRVILALGLALLLSLCGLAVALDSRAQYKSQAEALETRAQAATQGSRPHRCLSLSTCTRVHACSRDNTPEKLGTPGMGAREAFVLPGRL